MAHGGWYEWDLEQISKKYEEFGRSNAMSSNEILFSDLRIIVLSSLIKHPEDFSEESGIAGYVLDSDRME